MILKDCYKVIHWTFQQAIFFQRSSSFNALSRVQLRLLRSHGEPRKSSFWKIAIWQPQLYTLNIFGKKLELRCDIICHRLIRQMCSHRRKYTTNPSPYGRIRQVQNTTSCHNFDSNKLNPSTAPGAEVLNKDLLYKCKGTWYKFKFAEKRSLETSFFPHGMTCTKKFRNCIESFQKILPDIVVLTDNLLLSENAGFLFCPVLDGPYSRGSIVFI